MTAARRDVPYRATSLDMARAATSEAAREPSGPGPEASGPYRTQCGIIKLVDHDLT
jgi:hypothetical protein